MAAKKRELAGVVYVDGEPYGPGEVPADIAKQIVNEKAWQSANAEDESAAGDES